MTISREELIEKVKNLEIEAFIKSKENEEVYIKNLCYDNGGDCDLWIFGDNRCSCGNIKVHSVIEGDVVNGFSYYPSLG